MNIRWKFVRDTVYNGRLYFKGEIVWLYEITQHGWHMKDNAGQDLFFTDINAFEAAA
jgi:hypothetical protein